MATYLITGTNRGIGLALCQQLIARGDTVIALCRNPSTELTELGCKIFSGVDVTNSNALATVNAELRDSTIDVLINNAGVWDDGGQMGSFSIDSIANVLRSNAIAPLLVTQAFLPLLAKGSKVIMMTSLLGSIGDNTSGGLYSYRMSKAALNAATKSLAIDLQGQGITVGLIHPGLVATDMGGPNGIPVSQSAMDILDRISEYSLDNSGEFLHANGQPAIW